MKYPSIYAPSENGAFKRHDIFARRPASIQRLREGEEEEEEGKDENGYLI